MPLKFRVHLVARARPNFVKIAPLNLALQKEKDIAVEIVHTGQHYDPTLNEQIWADLGLPRPHHFLEVGGNNPSVQTALILERYGKILSEHRPDLVIVVGDVTSTFAACLAAKHQGIRVAHLEAGLRSFDRTMPEEVNRVLTDAIADFLWTPSQDGNENLLREGKSESQIKLVGNIMIDTLCLLDAKADAQTILNDLKLTPGQYGVMTLHRPSNVDQEDRLREILETAEQLSQKTPLIFSVHPRTKERLKSISVSTGPNLLLTPSLGYLAFAKLIKEAKFVVTDSGGIQEETSFRGVPCFTLRENTERPTTISLGTNQLAKLETLQDQVAMHERLRKTHSIPYWDGKTAGRVCDEIRRLM